MKRDSVYEYEITEVPGATIHHLRKAMDWTLRDLAERSGLDHTTIQRYEKNEGHNKENLDKVAKALGVKTKILSCPPEIAEIYKLPEKAQEEILALVKSALRLYRFNDDY